MWRHLVALMAGSGWLVPAVAAQAAVKVEVVATDPSADAILGRGETFNVRIKYTTDEPVRLWARPFFRGKEMPAASNGSREYVGSGYALGWFAFRERAQVDEVRIEVGGGKPYREWEVVRYPVRLDWTTAPAEPRESATWVAEMRAADRAAQRAEMQRRMDQPSSPVADTLVQGFILLVLGAMVAGIIAPVRAFRKWRGGWRAAAALPIALMVFAVGRVVVGTALDPTSHNLWPFELGTFALAGLAMIGVLALLRLISGANRS